MGVSENKSLELFKYGQKVVAKRGMILADTKLNSENVWKLEK